MTAYRKQKPRDTWHWVHECTQWPTYNYEEVTTYTHPPLSGHLCSECQRRFYAKLGLLFTMNDN